MTSERVIMKNNVLIMLGFVLLMTIQFMPSSAQLECWDRIQTCFEGTASSDEFQEECCPPLLDEIANERECFCGIKPILVQNVTIAGAVSKLLSLCTTTSFNTLCPGPVSSPPPVDFSEAPCWEEVDNCIINNVNRSETDPSLDPSSPSFNVTEFLCCPLMQETAVNDKHCFCSINTFVQQNPSFAPNITLVLSTCEIVHSANSLNTFCLGETSNPNSALPPMMPSKGVLKRLGIRT